MLLRKSALVVVVTTTIVLAMCAGVASGADISHDSEGRWVWAGDFQAADYAQFLALAEKGTPVHSLEIRMSRGGTSSVARAMQDYVADHNVAVSIKGACISACALIFLAAKQRTMVGGFFTFTYLHFHGSYRVKDGAFIPTFNDGELKLLKERTNGKFPWELYYRARVVAAPQGGLYVFLKAVPIGDSRFNAAFCRGTETRIPQDCEGLAGVSATSLGLIPD